MAKIRYQATPAIRAKSAKCKGCYLRVHFKNTVETANAIRNLQIDRAVKYLKNVIKKKQCIPFRKFNSGVSRCKQAKQFKTSQGRWPKKSCQYILQLLENVISNAKEKNLKMDRVFITHILVTEAPVIRRRMFRAHGRITPFNCRPCHIQIMVTELPTEVKLIKPEFVNPRISSQRAKKSLAYITKDGSLPINYLLCQFGDA